MNKLSLSDCQQAIATSAQEFKVFFEHGSLSVELYKPDKIDKQNPHDRDEVYIVASGEGKFDIAGDVMEVKAGDFLFVPARIAHKFFDFSDNFSTWVFFYGPAEGEKGNIVNHLRT